MKLFNKSDNCDYKNSADILETNREFLKRDLVEAKVQVDRWNVVTTDWIFHTSKKEMITSLFPVEEKPSSDEIKTALNIILKYAAEAAGKELKNDIDILSEKDLQSMIEQTNTKKSYHIWGAQVHFTDDMPSPYGMGIALNPVTNELMENDSDNINNGIVVFPVQYEQKRNKKKF